MEVGAAFVADPQALELVEPGKCPFDHPPGASEAGAVCGAASGDEGLDAGLPQQAAVLVEVVAAVGEQALWPVAGSPAQPTDRRDCVQQGDQLRDIVPVSAGQWRRPAGCRVGRRSHGAWSRAWRDRRARARHAPPFERPEVGAVDRAVVHLQQSRHPQLDQQRLVKLGPDSGFGPVPQPTPAGDPRTTHHLAGDVAPGHTLAQDVDDAGQRNPVRDPKSPRVAVLSFRVGRRQRGYALPQLIRDKVDGHSQSLPRRTVNCPPTRRSHFETVSKSRSMWMVKTVRWVAVPRRPSLF